MSVDDLDETVAEIKRVARPGGLFLLLTDVNHKATECEPIEFGWEIPQVFTDAFEKSDPGMYQSIRSDVSYDMDDPAERYGIISVKFRKAAVA